MFKNVKPQLYLQFKNWKSDLLLGSGIGIAFVILNVLTGIVIGIPTQPQSFFGKFVVVGGIAPLFEEVFFRGALLFILTVLPLALIPIILINGAGFSAFHWFVYGQSLAATNGSFVGALIFGMFATWITIQRKSIIPAIICHAIFNLWILYTYGFIIFAF